MLLFVVRAHAYLDCRCQVFPGWIDHHQVFTIHFNYSVRAAQSSLILRTVKVYMLPLSCDNTWTIDALHASGFVRLILQCAKTRELQPLCMYPVSQKRRTPYSCPSLCHMLTDFQNSFTVGLSSKRVMKWSLKTPPHLIRVATLPCET